MNFDLQTYGVVPVRINRGPNPNSSHKRQTRTCDVLTSIRIRTPPHRNPFTRRVNSLAVDVFFLCKLQPFKCLGAEVPSLAFKGKKSPPHPITQFKSSFASIYDCNSLVFNAIHTYAHKIHCLILDRERCHRTSKLIQFEKKDLGAWHETEHQQ